MSESNLKSKGNDAYKSGDYDRAVKLYTQALAQTDSHSLKATLYSNRSASLIKQQKWGQALADCDQGLALADAKSSLAAKLHWRKGVCERNLGMLKQAEQSLKLALASEPSNEAILKDLASLRYVDIKTLNELPDHARGGRFMPEFSTVDELPKGQMGQIESSQIELEPTIPEPTQPELTEPELTGPELTEPRPSSSLPFEPPSPLTLGGFVSILRQMVYLSQAEKARAHQFLFSISPALYKSVHQVSGSALEPDLLNLILEAIVACSDDAQWATQTTQILDALGTLPRYGLTKLFIVPATKQHLLALAQAHGLDLDAYL